MPRTSSIADGGARATWHIEPKCAPARFWSPSSVNGGLNRRTQRGYEGGSLRRTIESIHREWEVNDQFPGLSRLKPNRDRDSLYSNIHVYNPTVPPLPAILFAVNGDSFPLIIFLLRHLRWELSGSCSRPPARTAGRATRRPAPQEADWCCPSPQTILRPRNRPRRFRRQ